MMQFEKAIETMKVITERYQGGCYDGEHNEHFQGLFEKLSKQLNEMYPPNSTDFIPRLQFERKKEFGRYTNTYISKTNHDFIKIIFKEKKGGLVYYSHSNTETSKKEEYEVIIICNNKTTSKVFNCSGKARTWANEQYKEKVKEVLGL